MNDFPAPIVNLVAELATMPGVVAIALGGSRALGNFDAQSDWDIGLYYRGAVELTALRAYGEVHPPGSWGRLMNGGAWLNCEGHRVDVLLRDLDVVEHWRERAEQGDFEVDALLGYIAGAPTYMLVAELASCRILHGSLPAVTYPSELSVIGAARWRFCRSFSLAYARAQAERGNRIGAVGQLSKAVLEEAHAVLCERGQWVCNEKRMIEAAGLSDIQALFQQQAVDQSDLLEWISHVAQRLGVPASQAAPWKG